RAEDDDLAGGVRIRMSRAAPTADVGDAPQREGPPHQLEARGPRRRLSIRGGAERARGHRAALHRSDRSVHVLELTLLHVISRRVPPLCATRMTSTARRIFAATGKSVSR